MNWKINVPIQINVYVFIYIIVIDNRILYSTWIFFITFYEKINRNHARHNNNYTYYSTTLVDTRQSFIIKQYWYIDQVMRPRSSGWELNSFQKFP